MNSVPTHDPYSALRLRNYRLFFSGNVLATIGMQMQSTAIGWDIYQRTNNALMLGCVGLVQFLPIICLTLVAGHVADRYSRRWIAAASSLIVALASAMLAWISVRQADVRLIYVCLLMIGIARAFQQPAKASLVTEIVPAEHFGNAVTWNSSGFHLAAVVGPALAGLIYGWQGTGTHIYVIDALVAFWFVLTLGLLQVPKRIGTNLALNLRELAAGFSFVREQPIVFGAISLDMFAVLLGGATALLPIFAQDILNTGSVGLGWLRAAPAIGALGMGLLLAHRPPLRRAGTVLLWSVAGFGVATIIFGLSRSMWLSLVMLFLLGALDNVSVVIRHTLVQMLTPNRLRGRVAATNSLFIGASNELGGFESGLVAHFFGPVAAVVSGGLGTIVVVITTAWLLPPLRRYSTFAADPPD